MLEVGRDVADFDQYTGEEESSFPQIRWIEDLQNDFAARADWCVMSHKEANHGQEVKLDGKNHILAKAGETVNLTARASDPDEDLFAYSWRKYRETGTYLWYQ